MSSLTDILITNWQPDYQTTGSADTNSPKGTDSMAGNLDQELREIKSVARQESTNKAWERWLGLTSPASPSPNPPTFVSGTQFTLTNDWTSASTYYPAICQIGRRIRAFVSAGTIYGYITNLSFSGGLTTVTCIWDSGALDAGLTEVQFSPIMPSSNNLPIIQPLNILVGNPAFTLSNSAAQTTIWSTSIPARYLNSHGVVRCKWAGVLLNNTGSNQTVQVSGWYGGQMFFETDALTVGTATVQRAVWGEFELSNVGVGNGQFCSARVVISGVTNIYSSGVMGPSGAAVNNDELGWGFISVDSTLAQTLLLAFQFGAASANLNFKLYRLTLQTVNAFN